MSENVKQVVFSFLESHNPIPGDTEAQKLTCHYLDAKIIDSLGIVQMIMEFEEKFGIEFTSDDLQSEAFLTVGGVIGIIERLQGGVC